MASKLEVTNARVFECQQRGKATILVFTQSKKDKQTNEWVSDYYRALCVKEAREQAPLLVKGAKCTLNGFLGMNKWVDKHQQKRSDIQVIVSEIRDVEDPPEDWGNKKEYQVDVNASFTNEDIPF